MHVHTELKVYLGKSPCQCHRWNQPSDGYVYPNDYHVHQPYQIITFNANHIHLTHSKDQDHPRMQSDCQQQYTCRDETKKHFFPSNWNQVIFGLYTYTISLGTNVIWHDLPTMFSWRPSKTFLVCSLLIVRANDTSCNIHAMYQPSLALHCCITSTFCVLYYLVHDYKDLDTFFSLTLEQVVNTILFVLCRRSAKILW